MVTDGILVVDKTVGPTSQQVVGRVRRLAGTRKVGHAGTLDPMASGVLVVGIGRATRLLGHLMRTDKEYRATIRFGQATSTDDAEGEVLGARGSGGLDADQVAAALPAFTGEISQVPSSVSAIKVDGVRAYARARAGEEVTLAARTVTVHSFAMLSARTEHLDGLELLDVDVEVACTSGTYIRALARDLGERFGVGAHLTALRRTRVGAFDLSQSCLLEPAPDPLPVLGLDEVAAGSFERLDLSAAEATEVRHGRRLERTIAGQVAVFSPEGRFLALYRPSERGAVAEAVFRPA